MIGYWLLLGMSFWCVLRGIGFDAPFTTAWPSALLAITASMVAGFVLVVAPGGMGVREAIIVSLLTVPLSAFTETPEAAAAVSAAVLRILWIIVELICAGVFFLLVPGPGKNTETAEASKISGTAGTLGTLKAEALETVEPLKTAESPKMPARQDTLPSEETEVRQVHE